MMLAALLAAQSVVIGSESKALHLLGNEGPASVYFHLCLYDHHLRNNNRQSAQVCLLQAIDLYGIHHHARNPRSFDVDKDLFNRLKALKDDGSRRAVPAGPPGQTTYTAPNKLV